MSPETHPARLISVVARVDDERDLRPSHPPPPRHFRFLCGATTTGAGAPCHGATQGDHSPKYPLCDSGGSGGGGGGATALNQNRAQDGCVTPDASAVQSIATTGLCDQEKLQYLSLSVD